MLSVQAALGLALLFGFLATTGRWVGPGGNEIVVRVLTAASAMAASLLLFRLCLGIGISPASSLATTLALALASPVLVLARGAWPEALMQAAAFAGFLGALLAVVRAPGPATSLRLGVWAFAIAVLGTAFFASLVGAAVLVARVLRARRDERRRVLLSLACGAAGAGVMTILVAMLHRSPSAAAEPWLDLDLRGGLLTGLAELFLSPGKSVFLYCPPLALGVVALARAWRRERLLVLAWVAAVVPPVLLIAGRIDRGAGGAWGPRELVFLFPALLLPAGRLLDDLMTARPGGARTARLGILALVVAAGLFVQIVGSALPPRVFFRVAEEARTHWLGAPNRGAATVGSPGPGGCDPCFEDASPAVWLPPFAPIDGQLWLLRHTLLGDDWRTATADGPWRRYTRLPIDIHRSYATARLDWWFLDARRRTPVWAFAALALLGLATLASAAVLVASMRRRAREQDRAIARAVDALRRGEVVAYPTETFYGLGVNAFDAGAIARLQQLKARDAGQPISVLVVGDQMLATVVSEVPPQARRLMATHWPGALTLALPARADLPAALVKQGCVAVRESPHPIARALVAAFGGPITTSSANKSGERAAASPAAVARALGAEVHILHGGESPGGMPSTVARVAGGSVEIVRQGAVKFS